MGDDQATITSFLDVHGRKIEIEIVDEWPPTLTATHDGQKIGHLECDDLDGIAVLMNVAVETEYQRAGIATNMLQKAIELDPDFSVPNKLWDKSTGKECYLSEEGAAWINSCLEKNILSEKNEAPYGDQEEDEE